MKNKFSNKIRVLIQRRVNLRLLLNLEYFSIDP